MKTSELLLTILDITEDEYSFKAQFILKSGDKSKSMDIADLDSNEKLEQLRNYFGLEDSLTEISKQLMEKIMEKANISSKIVEGEKYEETSKHSRIERLSDSLDMA